VSLIDAALDRGARHLTLEVRSRNDAGLSLYHRFGLAPVGVRKGYYGDDDALVLWAHDIDSAEYAAVLDSLR
jgi:ribosomal-protein-alanine N-acetyltransferase